MKNIYKIGIIFLLMISILTSNIFAEEIAENSVVEESTVETGLQEKSGTTIDTIAKVIKAGEEKEVDNGGMKDTIQDVTIRIEEGDYEDEEFETIYNLSYDIEGKIKGYPLKEGDKVQVQILEDGENVSVTIIDYVRNSYMLLMFIIFLLSIVLIGGRQGVKAIIALLITILAVYFILIKGIFHGLDPIWTSIGTCMFIIIATFVVIGGINKKIITAALGTLGGVISAGIVASIFNYLCRMSGAGEDAVQLSISMTTMVFDFKDLLFAGIIISALGACMDVGMSIASSLDEIKIKNPTITYKELFASGMNIGRDAISTMTNTLILAYVGGAITLILLFMASNVSFVDIMNKETIAQEIVSAIAGSMGVVYTVPITAFVYSLLNKDKTVYRSVSENKVDGKRSLKI